MRTSHAATALAAFTAGLTAAAALRKRAGRPRVATAATPVPAPVPTPVTPELDHDAVVLPFSRPTPPAPAQPEVPAKCGESGGRTKAGAPCGARAASGGRCHHHRIAA